MFLKNITIQNLGGITHFSYEFREGLNIVKDERQEALSFAIRWILNHKTPPLPNISVGVGTKIEAIILLLEKEYRVTVTHNKSGEGFQLLCSDASGVDVTDDYLYLTKHSYEQDERDVFSGDASELAYCFLKYADEDRYYSQGELSRLTDGFSDTGAFRRYLKSFIDTFEPEPLCIGKSYALYLSQDGRYTVRYRDSGAVTNMLSASEKMLFKYLCFLRTAEFWHGFEELRNLHGIKKPMLISGFLEKLDESIDVRELLNRAKKLKRQTILITNKCMERGLKTEV